MQLGGGGYNLYTSCEGPSDEAVPYIDPYNSSGIVELWPEDDTSLGYPFVVTSCGWNDGEVVAVEIEYPDGRVAKDTVDAYEFGTYPPFAALYFRLSPDDPTGLYTVTFSGQAGKTSHNVSVVQPLFARWYQPSNDRNRVELFNFAPNERVTVFVYTLNDDYETASLADSRSFQTNRQRKTDHHCEWKCGSGIDSLYNARQR